MARGDELAFLAEERRVVDGEEHRHGWLVNGNRGQRFGILYVADGVANLKLLQTDDGADVAAVHLIDATVSHAVEGVQLLDLGLLRRTVAMAECDLHAVLQYATVHAAHGNTARIARIVERGDKHLRRAFQLLWSGNHLQNLVQQIGDVARRYVIVGTHPAVLGRAIDYGEVKLVFSGIEREHQVEHHLVDLLWPAVGLVHLVHHHNGLQSDLQCLLQHETGLRHGAFERVHQQQTAVGHVQHALHLAAEVGVSRSVDNVDFCSFPINRYVFRKNGDASFALQVISV